MTTFTMQELRQQLDSPLIPTWFGLGTYSPDKIQYLMPFLNYYEALNQWLASKGASTTFGLSLNPGKTSVDLTGLQPAPVIRSPHDVSAFTDVFRDIPTYLKKPEEFSFSQSAVNIEKLRDQLQKWIQNP